MKFQVSIYRDEDGVYVAECPAIPGCVSQGDSEADAEVSISEAIRECLAARAELGWPPTVTMREVEEWRSRDALARARSALSEVDVQEIGTQVEEMIQEARTLSVEERKQLIKALVDIVNEPEEAPKKRNIMEFAGIAAHLADEEDPQDYIKRLRSEWDERP